MRKVLGSLSLLVLLLNTLLTPITYAGEYEEIIVISSDSQKNQVEENGEEEDSSEFSVEEKNGDEENTGGIVDDGNGLTGDIVELGTGEIEDATGGNEVIFTGFDVEDITGTSFDVLSGVSEVPFGSGDISEEIIEYNSESIIGERTYDNVTVRVEALSGIFPEGTELVIEPIKRWNLSDLKDQLVEEKKEIKEDTTVVAFDITFIYSGEEVQPKEGEKVKVTFDYSNNEDLVEADKQENQEVKVYHIEDKDEEGNELEKEEQKIVDVTNKVESKEEGIAVADGESFSIYAVVTVVGEPETVHVTYNLNGGYWTESGSTSSETVTYTKNDSGYYLADKYFKTPSNTGFMFMGWYDSSNARWTGNISSDIDVHAVWGEFEDMDVYFISDGNLDHYTMMDRNLGATERFNQIYDGANPGSIGYHFQWGNNYGFKTCLTNNCTTFPGGEIISSGELSDSLRTKVIPSKYYFGIWNNTSTMWWSGNNVAGLWGGDTDTLESRQGPCPKGYHIPNNDEWINIIEKSKSVGTSPKAFSAALLLSQPGNRDKTGKKNQVPHTYWSSDSFYDNTKKLIKASYVAFNSDYLSFEIGKDIDSGRSIRCFKNVTTNSLGLSNINVDGGLSGEIIISSGTVIYLKNPVKQGFVFSGWYKDSLFLGERIGTGSQISDSDNLYAKRVSCQEGFVADDESANCLPVTNAHAIDQKTRQIISDLDVFMVFNDNENYHYTMMDRNLGATERFNGDLNNQNENSYGYVYQYGNNYGFTSTGSLRTISNFRIPYNKWFKFAPSNYSGNVWHSYKSSQGTWIEGVGSGNLWLWRNSQGTKDSMQGPCPDGYHVPAQNYMLEFLNRWKTSDKNKNVKSFVSSFLYPFVGQRNYDGTLESGIGEYWTSTPNNSYSSWSLSINSLSLTQGMNYSMGLPVRCFKINKNTDIYDVSNIHLSGGSNVVLSMLSSGEIIGLTDPVLNGHGFQGWYKDQNFSEGTKVKVGDILLPGDHLYAKWGDCPDGEIKTSWGCQITAEGQKNKQIVKDLDVYILGTNNKKHYTLMDRNMGADDVFNKDLDHPNEGSYGYYYQWGNNYGFYTKEDKPQAVPLYGDEATYSVDITPYSWDNPYSGYMFILGQNWMQQAKPNLWGGEEDDASHRQGPCPDGYHIPTSGDWGELRTLWGNTDTRAGNRDFSYDFLLPFAGFRKRGDSKFDSPGGKLRYHSASWGNNDITNRTIYSFQADGNTNLPYLNTSNLEWSSNAISVRCFKNVENDRSSSIDINDIHLNGGTKAIISVLSSGKINSLQEPSRSHSDFKGLYTTSGFEEGTKIGVGSGILPGTSLYANFVCNNGTDYGRNGTDCVQPYEIKFDSNGGSPVESQMVLRNLTGTKPEDPIRDGYEFRYWHKKNSPQFDFENTLITSKTELIAEWEPVVYNINYIGIEGATFESENPSTYTITTSTITLKNPTKPGSNFEGWSGTNLPSCFEDDRSSCSGNVTIKQGSTGDRIYEAMWGYVKYDLIFDSLEGSSVPSQRIIEGRTGTRPDDPVRNGYEFGGWFTDNGTFENEFDFDDPIVQNTTVYAKWILNEYNISYELNGGFMKLTSNGVETNLTGYTVNTPMISVKNPGKLNAIFVGWTGTDLSEATTSLSIPQGSTGDRSYIALYECEPGHSINENGECVGIRNADGTLNFDVWEHGTVDFQVGESKITMLDRNLGASTDDISNTGSYGFFYKWGNNYGFSPNHSNKYGATTIQVSDVSGYGPGTASGYYLSHDWIYSSNSMAVNDNNWFIDVNYDLWGDITNTQVARQGPCPDLYHVPYKDEVLGLIELLKEYPNTQSGSDCIETYGNKRLCFQNIMKIPTAGMSNYYSIDPSIRESTGRVFLWMTSERTNHGFSAFHSHSDEVNMTIGERKAKYAMPVRCFKNTDVVTVNYELNGGSASRWNNPQDLPSKTGYWYELKLGDGAKNPLDYTIKRANSTFSGWYLDSEFTKSFTGDIVYPYVTQDTTFYAKFDCVSPYVQSDDGQSCELPKFRVTYDAQAHSGTIDGLSTSGYTVDYNTQITLPTLESSDIVSLKGYDFVGWTTIRGGTEPISNTQTIVGDVTFYPIFKKDAIEKNMTFNLNGSEGFTYSGTDYLANTTLHLCTIEERYNNQEDLTGCEAIIQLPPISGSDNTPEVSGWSTGLDMVAIPVGTDLKITVDKDDIVNFYAQTYSLPKTYRLNYEYGTGVVSSAISSGSCEIAGTVNGIPQSGSCSILLPQLVLKQGFKDPLWYNRNHGYTGEVEVFGVGMDNGLNLEDGDVLTGIAHAKDDVKYVVKHYYQMLNVDGTELLENQYKSGRVEEKAGLAHSIIELSGEKFDDLMGYTYYTGTIQTTADEVDISGITTATTGEINPEGTLVITLFYTRDTYRVDWIDQGNTIKTENNLPYGVKVDHYKPVDPTKAKDEHYTYTFVGWYDKDDDLLTGDTLLETGTIYTSKYREDVRQYKITFVDDDGDVLKEATNYDYGTLSGNIVKPADPTKDPTPGTGYTFAGWYPEIGNVTQDQVYTATYDQIIRQYLITFVDDNGDTLKEATNYDYGTLSGDIVKPADPTKDPTYDTVYTFAGWYPEIGNVTQDQVYTAIYDQTIRQYIITFVDDDNTIIKSGVKYNYGTLSGNIVKPANPTKDPTYDTVYTFAGWNPSIENVTHDQIYKATYDSSTRLYTIRFVNYDGIEITSSEYDYGTASGDIVRPVAPGKPSDGTYDYIFKGWNPEITNVTTGATYTATYSGEYIPYLVSFKGSTGAVIASGYYHSGAMPVAPSDPQKASTDEYDYIFVGWNPVVSTVTGNITYEPIYTENKRSYTITWNNRDGTELKKDENMLYGLTPVYGQSDPIRPSTLQTGYTFAGWLPGVHQVTGPQVYTAYYNETTNSYPITWKNDDGTDIMTSQVLYGEVPSYTGPGLTKTGHTFSKWTPDLEPVVGTASYTASYTINQYKVTPQKGDGVADILGGGTYDYGTEVVLTGIAKEGYHFEGGVTVKEFTVEVPAKDITVILTAQPNTYYVHFKGNGGEGVMNDQEFTYDQEQELTPNAYTRNGYSFVSWTDGEGGIYKDKAVVKNLVASGIINLIAQWIEGDVPGPTPPTPTPMPSGGGGGGGSGRPIDKKTDEKEHDSAEEKQQEEIKDDKTKKDPIIQTGGDIKQITGDTSVVIPESVYHWTEEELTAYKFAYKYGITTLAPENAAMPDEYVQRGHMAKMVVNYALNVLHWKLPDKIPKQCKWKDGPNAWESQEIKDYAEKACALGIMGIDMKYFQPKKYVNRAQFGTIIGRLLRGKLTSKPYYAGHLSRLKERGIMTQIENPENRIEIRKWAWLMFMRMEKYQ